MEGDFEPEIMEATKRLLNNLTMTVGGVINWPEGENVVEEHDDRSEYRIS